MGWTHQTGRIINILVEETIIDLISWRSKILEMTFEFFGLENSLVYEIFRIFFTTLLLLIKMIEIILNDFVCLNFVGRGVQEISSLFMLRGEDIRIVRFGSVYILA